MKNKKITLTGILSLRSKGKRLQAFTLVELIVVITILAILGTIAFISLQGYSQDARDSVRISDISKIKTSLELFQLNAGKYPETTDYFAVTYSGAVAWTQGTFGTTTYSNVEKLDKIPTDPVTDRKYVYSVTNTRQEYQIAGIMEGDEVTINTNQANVAGKTAMLKISGNYNGKVLKVSTGGTDYVLAVPSIITSSGFALEQIVASKFLAYNGYKNLPAQYAGSSYEVLGDNGINLVNSSDLVVFSGNIKDLSDTTSTGVSARADLMTKLKSAYSGTAITNVGEIAQMVNVETGNIESLASTIISNNLGGSIVASIGGGDSSGDTLSSPKTVIDCGVTSGEIIYSTLDGTDSGLTCDDDIMVCNGITGSGYTIQACNAGAIIVYSNQIFASQTMSRDSTVNEWAGGLYQWGNNAENSITPTRISQIGATTSNSTYSNSQFVKGYSDWTSSSNNNLWGYNSGLGTDIQRKGPCDIGYHVPTKDEWVGLIGAGNWLNSGGNIGNNMKISLKLPFAGYRGKTAGTIYHQDSRGHYWFSSPYDYTTIAGDTLRIGSNSIEGGVLEVRADGYSVRCFKN